MHFENRIKKEMTEGIVKAILEDAGYRVIDSGIEKVLREISCLSRIEYQNLGYPDAMRYLPDFTVMDRDQKTKHLIEVKYRNQWSKELLLEVREKVRIFGEIILVSVNANPPLDKVIHSPAEYLRCCSLKMDGEGYKIRLSEHRINAPRHFHWEKVDDLQDEPKLWWRMAPLQEVFEALKERKADGTLLSAVQSLAGILSKPVENNVK